MAKKVEKKAPAKPLTKTQIVQEIAAQTNLTKKDVNNVFAALSGLIGKSLAKGGAGSFTLPGLVKIDKKVVPAQPARKHVENPFKKGEFRDVPAKPAHNKIRIKALKALKEMA